MASALPTVDEGGVDPSETRLSLESDRDVPDTTALGKDAASSSAPCVVFISASALARFWRTVPPHILESCLMFFGSKRSWFFPANAAERLEAAAQPGAYEGMAQEFKRLVARKEARGQVWFLKRPDLEYDRYPGPPDAGAFARASVWLQGLGYDSLRLEAGWWADTFPTLGGRSAPRASSSSSSSSISSSKRAVDGTPDITRGGAGGADSVAAGTDTAGGAVEAGAVRGSGAGDGSARPPVPSAPRRRLRYERDVARIVRNFEGGYHEYDEVMELLHQSDARLLPMRYWDAGAAGAAAAAGVAATATSGRVTT